MFKNFSINRYFCLELCNCSLDHVFLPAEHKNKYEGKMPSHLEAMTQLAEGLVYIHSRNLVHRDIKPQNVLILMESEQSIVMKWADFGLSKRISVKGTYSMTNSGTVGWMSPEVLKKWHFPPEGEEAAFDENLLDMDEEPSENRGTPKSDVFSAGCVFAYLLLGGKHPYGSPIMKVPGRIHKGKIVNLECKLLFITCVTYFQLASLHITYM